MPNYHYKAVDKQGHFVRSEMLALNEIDLEMRLQKQGFDLVRCFEKKNQYFGVQRKTISNRQLVQFCFQMEQCLQAGIPIIDILKDLADESQEPNLGIIYAGLVESIEGGLSLSEAMGDYPEAFDALFCNLVRTGETSGQLTRAFKSLGENIAWIDEQTKQVRRTMIYPLMVLTVVLIVIIVLMVYLVPQMLLLLAASGEAIPIRTLFLINISNVLVKYWPFLLAIPVGLLLFIWFISNASEKYRQYIERSLLELPLLGSILQKAIIARFTGCFSMMYGSGITVLESLHGTENIVKNTYIQQKIKQISRLVSDGKSLSESFTMSGIFPSLVIRMVRVGENTGSLHIALDQVCQLYSRDVKESITKLQTIIEPTLTIFLAAIVLWVISSVLGPIYDVISEVAL